MVLNNFFLKKRVRICNHGHIGVVGSLIPVHIPISYDTKSVQHFVNERCHECHSQMDDDETSFPFAGN